MINSKVAYSKMNTRDIQNAYSKSYTYEKTQNYNDSIKALKLVLMHYPETYTVNLRLGYLFLLNKKFANAEKHYHKAQKIFIYLEFL